MKKVLGPRFFNRPTLTVARELLGKFLVRRQNKKLISLIITEVEAYDGPNDKASHASRGKTERNKIMFGEAGKWYVYFIYGMHWMLNIVTGPKNYPAAILIRGTKEVEGPARLTKYLKINKKFNGKPANKKTGLWIAAPTKSEQALLQGSRKIKIKRAPRIGVNYAGKWANKLYRFFIQKSVDIKRRGAK